MKNRLYKALSIVLTLMTVFSVCVCAFNTVSAAGTEVTYYVANTGAESNNGLTADTPFKTIGRAIAVAKASGLGEGDTVNIKLCKYAAVGWGASVDYDFHLAIESNDPALRSGVTLANGFKFTGDVSFKYVRMDGMLTNIYYNNHNVNIASDCAFAITNHYMGSDSGAQASDPQTVVLSQSLASKNVFVGDNGKAKTYKEDVTLGINNATSTAKVTLGSASGLTTFEKDLNINIMQSKTIDFEKAAGDIDVNGALQVVVNSDTAILNEEKALLSSINAEGGYYYITNATRVSDILKFTETAGTYIVDTGRYAVKATDKDGNEYLAEAGKLVLPEAGEYVLTVVKAVENPVYYVSSTAGNSLNDGLTPETPLCAVNEVITAAVEAGYWEGDTVYVNVLSSTVEWSNEFETNSTTNTIVDEYDFLLCVQSNNKSSLSTVNFVFRQFMTGDVEFQNIKLNIGSSNGSRPFYSNNHSVTIGENVSMPVNNLVFGNFNGSGKFDGQSITVKNALNATINLGNDGHHNGRNFAEDVFLTLDNPKIKTKMYITCYHGGTTTMQKNFNIQIKAAESAEFLKGSTITADTVTRIAVGGAVQLIANDDVILSRDSIDVIGSCANSGEFYYLTNSSGIKDLLEFTETAGKYKVNLGSDRCVVYAIDESGNTVTSKDGYLTLPASGEYIIDAKVMSVKKEYYVSAEGTDENDGLTTATPVATVDKAIALAKADGCVEGDSVVIKFAGANYTLTSVPTYSFDVKFTSASDSTKTFLNISGGEVIAGSTTATTTFDNVKIQFSKSWSGVFLAGSNTVFTENCEFSGTSCSVGSLTGNGGGASVTYAAQKIVFESKTPYSVLLSNSSYASVTRTQDVELVINNSEASPKISFNANYNGSVNGTTKYRNINLDFKSASKVEFISYDKITVEGAVQIIDSANLGITSQFAGLADITADKYIITNTTGIKDIVAFTETAGKFAVDSDKYELTATADGIDPIYSKNGYIMLPKAGDYTLTLTHTHTYDSECDAQCGGCDHVNNNIHVYDDSCDTECNLCGSPRTVKHTYDNACDKLCNVCYEYRTTSHKFSNVVDRECDVCGAMRKVVGAVLFKEASGKWFYYVDGVKSTDTTLVKYAGKWFYIQKGEWKATTALVKYQGKYFYIKGGKWDNTVTDLIKYNGKWFYVKNGKWANTADTLMKINGKWFLIKGGMWKATTGLVKYKGKYFFVKGGKWSSSVNTLYKKSGKWFAIKSGKWYTSKAIISYNGKKFYCNKGYAQLKYSGKVTVNKKTYTIKKGVVK